MNECCAHLHREAIKELGFKDRRIIELEKEVTRLFEPTREFWNNETRDEVARLQAENEMMRTERIELDFNLDAFGGWLIEKNCPTSVLQEFKRAREILKKIDENKREIK